MKQPINNIQIANATSRAWGAIGKNAVVPQAVRKIANKTDNILDFGAGKSALHTLALREEGYMVTAYEFGGNIVRGLHDPRALDREYDLVYASNVLNVQNSISMLRCTIKELCRATKRSGRVLINLPESPRKGAYTNLSRSESEKLLVKYLKESFKSIEKINKKSFIFELRK